MTFSTDLSADRWTLILEGDVNGQDGEESVLHLANQAIGGGARIGIIDISAVRFMNSSGIAMLLKLLTRFRQKGGEVFVLSPPESVRRMLVMTRLEAVFQIINSSEEARLPGGKP